MKLANHNHQGQTLLLFFSFFSYQICDNSFLKGKINGPCRRKYMLTLIEKKYAPFKQQGLAIASLLDICKELY